MKAIEEVERKMGLFNADMVRTIFLEKEAPKRLVGRAERGAVHVGVKDTSCGGTIICWSQGDARDNRSVFAKCVISGRAAAAEVGEEARNWGAGGRSSCQRERKSCWMWRKVVTKKSRSSCARSWMTGRQKHEERRNRQRLECGENKDRCGRRQQQDHAAKEVGARRRWVLNTTAKDLIFISWVASRKGCIDGQLTKREALSMPWLSAMLTPFFFVDVATTDSAEDEILCSRCIYECLSNHRLII